MLFTDDSSPTIRDCILRNNYADESGGAVQVSSSSPRFERCRIEENSARTTGGGVAVFSGAPVITDCTISDNFSEQWAGGLILSSTNARVVRSLITRNRSVRQGGGIASRGDQAHTLEGCVVSRNTAPAGAALYCYQDSNIELLGCIVLENEVLVSYGSILADNNLQLTIINSVIARNAGGITCLRSTARITNSTIAANGPPGGAALVVQDADVIVKNTVLFNNAPRQITVQAGADPVVSYSDVEGGWPGEGNIDANPLFVGGGLGSLRLGADSPCIDAGDNTAVPDGLDVDLDGLPRFVDDPETEDTGRCEEPCERAIVDMGAYEYSRGACCVDDFADCTNDVRGHECLESGGRFAANVACGDLDPPCGTACIREPEWRCDGDVDGDGQVNPVDSGLVQAAFCAGEDCAADALCQYDLDCDDQINPVDSGIVQSLFGTCDPPREACP
jgi:hypothetical protein